MSLEVTVPAQFLSPIIGDLNSRRASITEIETSREPNTVRATVPLAEFFGYSTVARSLSQGRANYSLEPLEYRPVPLGLVQKIAD
jgi:elongation factor G